MIKKLELGQKIAVSGDGLSHYYTYENAGNIAEMQEKINEMIDAINGINAYLERVKDQLI